MDQERVEMILIATRREEAILMKMILKENTKEKRMELARLKSIMSRKKAAKWRKMLELLRGLDIKH